METNFEQIGEVTESRTFHQLGILILDGSGSMSEIGDGNITKAENVNRAVRDFLSYFKGSSIANNISVAVVVFADSAKVIVPVTELTKVDDFGDYNPQNHITGGTYIGSALEEAEKLSTSFLNQPEASSVPHDVRFILMSDGCCGNPSQTKSIASVIKQNSNGKLLICSTIFTNRNNVNDADVLSGKDLLVELASEPKWFKSTFKETDLRQFFISSMSAKTKFSNNGNNH